MRYLILAIFLSGCASTTVKPEYKIGVSLLQPCPKLEKLEGTDGKTVIKWALEVVTTYNGCKRQHENLIEAVKVTGKEDK